MTVPGALRGLGPIRQRRARRYREPLRLRISWAAVKLAARTDAPLLLGPERLERMIAGYARQWRAWDSSRARSAATALLVRAELHWRPVSDDGTVVGRNIRPDRWTAFVWSAVAHHDWLTFDTAIASVRPEIALEILRASEAVNQTERPDLAVRWLACGDIGRAQETIEPWVEERDDALGAVVEIIEPSDVPTTWVLPESHVELALPPVWKRRTQWAFSCRMEVPRLGVHTLENVDLVRGSTILRDGAVVLVDQSARPSDGFVAGQWDHLGGAPSDSRRAVLHAEYRGTRRIDEAVLLGGRCDFNHFHLLIEYLPRIGLIDRVPQLADIPLLVADDISPAGFEAVQAVAGGRPVISISRDDLVHIGRLHVPSMHTYHPDSTVVSWIEGARYSPVLLGELRERLLPLASTRTDFARLIFLTRSAGLRGVVNSEQVADVIREFDFATVDSAELSLGDQIALFSNLQTVVAVGGAGLANMLFAPSTASVVAMVARQLEDYATHATISRFVGADFTYVLGVSDERPGEIGLWRDYLHAPFRVDPAELRACLRSVLGDQPRRSH